MQNKITQQEDNINDLEERIACVTDEMNKLSELFTDTKKELEEASSRLVITSSNLERASDVLTRTKTTLRQTEKERDEKTHLLSEHVMAETQLYGQATQLLGTTESSISDVHGLHAKLDRKRHVEAHNEQVQKTFQQQFDDSLKTMHQEVVNYTDSYHAICSQTTQQLALSLNRQEVFAKLLQKEFSAVASLVATQLQQLNSHQREQCSTAEQWANTLTSDVNTAQAREEERLTEVASRMVMTGMSSVEEKLRHLVTEMQSIASIVHKQKEDQEQLFCDQKQQLWESIVGLSAVVEDHTDQHSKQLETLQAVTKNHSVDQDGINRNIHSKLEELMALVTKQNANQTSFTQQVSNQLENSQCRESLLRSQVLDRIDNLHGSLDDAEKAQQTLLTEHCTSQISHLQQCGSATEDCLVANTQLQGDLNSALLTTKQTWKEHAERVSQQVTNHVGFLHTQLDNLTTANEKLTGDCSSHLDRLTSNVTESQRQAEDEHRLKQQLVKDALHTVDTWSSSVVSGLETRREEVQAFLQRELRQDVPTGQTPQRREFTYPRTLTKTEEHDTLRGRFHKEYVPGPDIFPLHLMSLDGELEEERTRSDSDPTSSSTSGIALSSSLQADDSNLSDEGSEFSVASSGVSSLSRRSKQSVASLISESDSVKENCKTSSTSTGKNMKPPNSNSVRKARPAGPRTPTKTARDRSTTPVKGRPPATKLPLRNTANLS